ncbi:MAG TPA: SRPBCC domain-containing protein [Bacteroidales bacterium]|nr:SRPBCC domain-containing protein [Bacteroidales bacterium]
MNAEPVTFEKAFQVPVSRLWKALTDESEMKKWYFDIPGFRAEVGFEFRFFGGPEDRQYMHICRITEVIPVRKIAYNWRYEGYEGNSMVTFELTDENGNSRLRLTHEGLETFPQDNLDFDRRNFEAGWHDIINRSLMEYLGKHAEISMGY